MGRNSQGPIDGGTDGRSVAHVRAGRIVEVRVGRLAEQGDVEALHGQVKAAVRSAGPGAVICADHRRASLLTWEAADAWSRRMRGSNVGILRSGLLLDPENATYNLQIERVVRLASNPAQRLFEAIEDLRGWVGAVLSEGERGALRDLFSDAPPLRPSDA